MGVLHEAAALLASALGTLPLSGAVAEPPGVQDGVSLHGSEGVSGLASGAHTWTFAYGANIGRAKLDRVGIHPKETLPGKLRGHRLVFNGNLTDGPAEPAYADVVKSAAGTGVSPVQGVLHSVTDEELKKLDKTETALYHRVELPVQVQLKGQTRSIPAWTYVDNQYGMPGAPPPPERAPSVRYGRLVVCGAEEVPLPGAYTRAVRRYLGRLGLPQRDLSCDAELEPKLRGLRSFLHDSSGRAQVASR
mmetsp:Transcript_118112/g.367965  ORF Transcript_118112/g.367965 Transcript_118112/m.367965 type:complete len:248 (+) Transcript_118112:50-793(+)